MLNIFSSFLSPIICMKYSFQNKQLFAVMSSGFVNSFNLKLNSNKRIIFEKFSDKISNKTFEISPCGTYVFGISSKNFSELNIFKNKVNSSISHYKEPWKTFSSEKKPIK